jgi:hypothetical protein
MLPPTTPDRAPEAVGTVETEARDDRRHGIYQRGRHLITLRGQVDALLDGHRAQLEKQLARIGSGGPAGSVERRGALKGAQVAPKYHSKKDKSLTWSSRGAVPRWMTADMKGTKLKKDAFLIK